MLSAVIPSVHSYATLRLAPQLLHQRYVHPGPPLLFGRRPPQSNCPPCTVPVPDDGTRLDIHNHKGGISRVAPRELAPALQSLPPILHMQQRMPVQSYSKGSWGLSV